MLEGHSVYQSTGSPPHEPDRQEAVQARFDTGDLVRLTIVEPTGWYVIPQPAALEPYSQPDVITFTQEGATITVTITRGDVIIDEAADSYQITLDVRYLVSSTDVQLDAIGKQTAVFTRREQGIYCEIRMDYTITDSRLSGPATDTSSLEGLLAPPQTPPPTSELDGDWQGLVRGESVRQVDGGAAAASELERQLSVAFQNAELSGVQILPPQGWAFPTTLFKLSHVGDRDEAILATHTYFMRVNATLRELEVADTTARLVVDFTFDGQNPGNSVSGSGTQTLDLQRSVAGVASHVMMAYAHDIGFISGPQAGSAPSHIQEGFTGDGDLAVAEGQVP
jgi:hypothetical protein